MTCTYTPDTQHGVNPRIELGFPQTSIITTQQVGATSSTGIPQTSAPSTRNSSLVKRPFLRPWLLCYSGGKYGAIGRNSITPRIVLQPPFCNLNVVSTRKGVVIAGFSLAHEGTQPERRVGGARVTRISRGVLEYGRTF